MGNEHAISDVLTNSQERTDPLLHTHKGCQNVLASRACTSQHYAPSWVEIMCMYWSQLAFVSAPYASLCSMPAPDATTHLLVAQVLVSAAHLPIRSRRAQL